MKDNRHLMDKELLTHFMPCPECKVLDHEWIFCGDINIFLRIAASNSTRGFRTLENIDKKRILNHHDGPRIASKLAILELSK